MMRSKNAFTLIELLVYIVIAAIIVGLAGQAFLDATRSRIRTTFMLEASMGTGDVIAYMDEDVRRLGAKAWMQGTSSSSVPSSSSVGLMVEPAVYWDLASTPIDSSSFDQDSIGVKPNRMDKLEFKAANYDPSNGTYSGWEQIRYSVDGAGSLWRTVVVRKDASGADISPLPAPVRMAEHVVGFQLRFGVQKNDSVVFDQKLYEPCAATSSASSCFIEHTTTTAGISANSGIPEVKDLPAGDSVIIRLKQGASPSTDESFDIVAGRTYRVEIGVGSNDSAAENFRPALDFMAARVVHDDDPSQIIPGTSEVLLYSAYTQSIAKRIFDFTPSDGANPASIAIKFQMRSSSSTNPMAAAAFRFDQVSVYEISRDAYEWHENFSSSQIPMKARVRAIEVSISIQQKNSVSTSKKVIQVVNNGV